MFIRKSAILHLLSKLKGSYIELGYPLGEHSSPSASIKQRTGELLTEILPTHVENLLREWRIEEMPGMSVFENRRYRLKAGSLSAASRG